MRLRCSQCCPDFLFVRSAARSGANGVREKRRAAARQSPPGRRRAVCAAPFPFVSFLSLFICFSSSFLPSLRGLFAFLLSFFPLSLPFSFLFLPILPFVSFFSFRAPTRPTPRNKIPAGGASPARMAESRQVALRRPNLAIPRFGYIFPLCAGFAALRRCRSRMNPMIGALPRARGASGRNRGGAGPESGSSRWCKEPSPADGGASSRIPARRAGWPLFFPPPLPLRAPRPAGRAFCAGSSVMRVFRRLPGSG